MAQEKKELNIQIGARIKKARERAGMTQEHMAELIDVSVQYVSDLERGKTGASVSTIIKICRTLQTSSDELLLGRGTHNQAERLENYLSGMNEQQLSIAEEGLRLLLRAFSTDK